MGTRSVFDVYTHTSIQIVIDFVHVPHDAGQNGCPGQETVNVVSGLQRVTGVLGT